MREADTTLKTGAEHTTAVTTAVTDFLDVIDAVSELTTSLSADAHRALNR